MKWIKFYEKLPCFIVQNGHFNIFDEYCDLVATKGIAKLFYMAQVRGISTRSCLMRRRRNTSSKVKPHRRAREALEFHGCPTCFLLCKVASNFKTKQTNCAKMGPINWKWRKPQNSRWEIFQKQNARSKNFNNFMVRCCVPGFDLWLWP